MSKYHYSYKYGYSQIIGLYQPSHEDCSFPPRYTTPKEVNTTRTEHAWTEFGSPTKEKNKKNRRLQERMNSFDKHNTIIFIS